MVQSPASEPEPPEDVDELEPEPASVPASAAPPGVDVVPPHATATESAKKARVRMPSSLACRLYA